MKGSKSVLLLQRLKEIAEVLKQHPHGLALLGLGSSGKRLALMDEYSDLDFFAIVAEGSKRSFIQDLSWLADIKPIAYCFRNTEDGYKLLFEDGVFCEFAVFEVSELAKIPYEQGQFVWRDESISASLAIPTNQPFPISVDEAFLLGELLTNLYVGLCRYRRGEHCSAMRFIQVYALDRLISLLDKQLLLPQLSDRDAYCVDRRAEQRHPQYAALLKNCLQGVDKLPFSAASMLAFVEQHYPVEAAIKEQIQRLL